MSDNQNDASVILSTEQRRRACDTLHFKGLPMDMLEDLRTFKEFDYWWTQMYGYRYCLSVFLNNLKLEGIE